MIGYTVVQMDSTSWRMYLKKIKQWFYKFMQYGGMTKLQCIPSLLELFIDKEPHWYETMCYLKLHFYLNLLVDMLQWVE